jgi:hypothetical protein
MNSKIETGWRHCACLKSLRQSILLKIVLIVVSGLAGVRGNEHGDRFAGIAVISNDYAMDHADARWER